MALLFDVDPDQAEVGVPLTHYVDAIHPEDRERVLDLIRRSASEGSTFLTEYRVISVDGQTRWVLARGRFTADHQGRPVGGGGILVDITSMRMSEGTFGDSMLYPGETPLDRAADHAIAAQEAIAELRDPDLKAQADALLISLGRRLAQQEVQARRRNMN
ncbi:PAS domain-containing protein [Methylobacterium sp. NMS14P]|uniref:PAS domain-containing protein n=1 Tax=Methylobacterium sp. NMS14P TaxID=2894310 RepID=UPI0030767E35